MLPHVFLTISLSIILLIYCALFILTLATSSYIMYEKTLPYKCPYLASISRTHLYIFYTPSRSMLMSYTEAAVCHTPFSLRLMIAWLSHAPLCYMITEFHISLLFLHNMNSRDNSTPPILILLHLFSGFFMCFPSHYPICVLFM